MKPGVIMLVNEFPPLPVGGAERQAERLSGYLAQNGWPVQVLTRKTAELPPKEKRNGFEIIRPATFGPGKLKTISFVLGSIFHLWKVRRQFEIVHAHLAFGPAFAGVIVAHLLNKKVIVKLGNSGKFGDIYASQQTSRGRLRLAVLRKWADLVIALDSTMEAEALAAGFAKNRVRRMFNGIEAEHFAPTQPDATAKARLGLQDKIVLLYMGRFAPQKSLPTLLMALAKAKVDCPQLHLLLLGDGPEKPALETMAKELGISTQVTFVETQADVCPYLNAADMFVLPSLAEGISNALLEAMAAGLACLTTPTGGSPEVLEQGQCGLLLPAEDPDSWAKAMAELGNDPVKRKALGEAAQKRIADHFDFSVVGAQYETLYLDLIGK